MLQARGRFCRANFTGHLFGDRAVRGVDAIKLSRKDQEQIAAALERMRQRMEADARNREERLWSRRIPAAFSLRDLLGGLTKDDLHRIRRRLGIAGISALPKQELQAVLEDAIPQFFEQQLQLLDSDQLRFLLDIAGQGGSTNRLLEKEQLAFFRDWGWLAPGQAEGRRRLAMPSELVVLLNALDKPKWEQQAEKNGEWIRLTQGLLYYYGVLPFEQLHQRVSALAKRGGMSPTDYLNLLELNAIPYYDGIRFCDEGIQYYRVFDAQRVVREHKARPEVEYYPFLYQQLMRAGQKDFTERTPAYRQFAAFIAEHYDIDAAEADRLVEECVYAIQIQHSPSDIMEFLQSNLEIDARMLERMLHYLVALSNTTRQWILKGYTPDELFERDKVRLEPLPEILSLLQESPVPQKAVGRNDPCPCGSGKKYKKCCGK